VFPARSAVAAALSMCPSTGCNSHPLAKRLQTEGGLAVPGMFHVGGGGLGCADADVDVGGARRSRGPRGRGRGVREGRVFWEARCAALISRAVPRRQCP
jgi:hypothetical protein